MDGCMGGCMMGGCMMGGCMMGGCMSGCMCEWLDE